MKKDSEWTVLESFERVENFLDDDMTIGIDMGAIGGDYTGEMIFNARPRGTLRAGVTDEIFSDGCEKNHYHPNFWIDTALEESLHE